MATGVGSWLAPVVFDRLASSARTEGTLIGGAVAFTLAFAVWRARRGSPRSSERSSDAVTEAIRSGRDVGDLLDPLRAGDWAVLEEGPVPAGVG